MTPNLYTLHKITGGSEYRGKLALVTYVGKFGYTLSLLDAPKQLSCSTSYASFIQSTQTDYLVNPLTNLPCQSVEEFKHFYPEYFI